MEEKVLSKKKNGMAALFCIMVLYAVSVAGILFGMRNAYIEFIIGGIFVAGVATILIAGLKVLKPQEALVLTLFGKYVGTLKEDGFYFVNPFCTSVNPAARTKLNQSGDVSDSAALMAIAKKAMEKDTGARALRAIIEEFMMDIMYEIPKDDNIGQVTITEDYIEHRGGPVITMRGVPALGMQG